MAARICLTIGHTFQYRMLHRGDFLPPQEPEVVIPVGEFSTEMQARFASVIRPFDIELSRSALGLPQAVSRIAG